MEIDAVRRRQDAAKGALGMYLKIHVLCRLSAGVAALAAASLMGLNKQTSNVAGFQIKASYTSSPAFEFFVIGNAIACGYSMISLPFVSNLGEGFLLNLLDLMNLALLMAAATAAATIGYVGKYGNSEIGWAKVCPYYEKFCERAVISMACSYVAFFLFLSICALSSVYRCRLSNND